VKRSIWLSVTSSTTFADHATWFADIDPFMLGRS
jgi:hypothetical protein